MPKYFRRASTQQAEPPPLAGRTAQYFRYCNHHNNVDALQLVECILADAIEVSASDIHIEPWREGLVIRFRLAGILHRHVLLPVELSDRVSGRFKVMADMERFRPVTPQEGGASPGFGSQSVQLRISIFPTKRGEKIVVRLFDTRERSFSLDGLGFAPEVSDNLKSLLQASTGAVLFTGPTGSGKTTAIYSSIDFLQKLHGERISIVTVEDPVEFDLQNVSQSEIAPEREFTYPVALRSLMRQDPQVIGVGEIRDPETAAIAIQAGLTGHLVLSTVHSPGTAGVFARLLQMGLEPFILASSVLAVVGMRLVRVNCPYCCIPVEPDRRWLKFLSEEQVATGEFRRGEGCDACGGGGFAGRKAIAEFMTVDAALHDAIVARSSARRLAELARAAGMIPLWERGLQRVLVGEVMLEELVRVAPPVDVTGDRAHF